VTPIELIAAPRKLKYSGKRAFAAFLLLTALTPGRAQIAASDPATGLCRSIKLTHLCSDKLTHRIGLERVFSFQGVGQGR
jgi:hypothetical protein